MKKKLISALLCATMAATLLVGCGGKEASAEKQVSDEGKVLNIYVWNEEWRERVELYYPGYEKVSDEEGKIGDVTVKWVTNPNADNVYQTKLDEALLAQADAPADEKVDIFLVEADYALKYVDTDYTLTMADIGLDDSVFADQYKYTKDVVTDSNGNLKGSSWQGCPAAMIYNRNIAKAVLGTDEPAEVQKAVADWDTFLATADKMSAAGYRMTATTNDTMRVFSNNVTTPWVVDGKIQIDDNIVKWVEMSKAMVDKKQTTTEGMWDSDEWKQGFMTATADVFAYFGPAWFIDFSMNCAEEGSVGSEGGWAVTEGPQGFFWGGTWVCACNGTDNKTLVADVIKTMTTDDAVLEKIVTEKSDFVNDSAIMEKFANDSSFGNKYLGGQNPYGIFSAGVSKVDLSCQGKYDQACVESMQEQMKNYFVGNATYEEALEAFYKAVETKHPELTH